LFYGTHSNNIIGIISTLNSIQGSVGTVRRFKNIASQDEFFAYLDLRERVLVSFPSNLFFVAGDNQKRLSEHRANLLRNHYNVFPGHYPQLAI
jgi:hypothetical protein